MEGEPLRVPCGRCLGCQTTRARDWAVRCVHESTLHDRSCFITLTYSPQQLPKDWSLDVRHFQLFCKKLRKRKGPFRFFHCGEYGERSLRPHYHALLFGIDFSSDRVPLGNKKGLFTSKTLEECWTGEDGEPRGNVSVGSLTTRSAYYVASYCVKKLGEVRKQERLNVRTGEIWEVKPPYVTMSRRPGIGSGWFDKYHSEVYPEDEVVLDGRKFRPPRFYDQRLERLDFGGAAGVRARRRQKARENPESVSMASRVARESEAYARLALRAARG